MDQSETLPLDDIAFTAEERAGIEEAVAQADAGILFKCDDVLAWLHSLDTNHPHPRPEPANPRQG